MVAQRELAEDIPAQARLSASRRALNTWGTGASTQPLHLPAYAQPPQAPLPVKTQARRDVLTSLDG